MNNKPLTPSTYKTLTEIKLRKAMLLKDIQKDDNRMRQLWDNLFHKPTALRKNAKPSKRISSLMTTGAGFFDTILLAWKLYKKFKR
ncbi:MAG: hypothetical protein ACOYJK_06360 [Prevotella sp.]|jgi:hypothetical protein